MANQPLIIVESPSKAKTIARYLGNKYRVLASMGHIKDLPKKDLGISIVDDFRPKYVILSDKYKIIKQLKQNAEKAPEILIATDPDREGEAIAWHIATELDGKAKKIKRVIFTEITPTGIISGIENLREIDRNLVDAQQARRVIDRIVGFQVSEFLWKVLYSGLSAGRVQSVALRLVCNRHEENINFIPTEYWSLAVQLSTDNDELFTAKLHKISGKSPEIPDETTVKNIISALHQEKFQITSISHKNVRKRPYPPFITSTLQQETAQKLGLTPSQTMRIAQRLYEGIDIGKGEPIGLITYMRTDSTRLSNDAINSARSLISDVFGKQYVPKKPLFYTQKKKSVQDAHEAIRPTNVHLTPETLSGKLEKNELRLYQLIWQRFVACQMNPSVIAQTVIDTAAGGTYLFRTVGSVMIFDGFRRVYPTGTQEKKSDHPIPEKIQEGETVIVQSFDPEQHFTKPPPYYSESSLIKELDSRGIGRPSTFAETVFRLYKREYVEKVKGKLIPTERGLTVNKILVANLPDIFDFDFTARMEDDLDDIESGNKGYYEVVNHFYKPFRTSMELAQDNRAAIKLSLIETTEEICEKCGKPMVIKWNRRGEKFLACSGFPECKNAKSLKESIEDDGPEILEKPCPKCGKELLIKTGRYGRYVGCGNYPECKHTEPLTTGISCPKQGCDGEIVERTSKKKKVFYGCSKYPNCDYVSWRKPIQFHCKECGNHYIEEYVTQKRGTYYVCPNCKTQYTDISEEPKGDKKHED